MQDYKLDRTVEYNGVVYKIIELLNSGNLLVVEKEVFDTGVFPMSVQIIPGE